MIFSTAMLGCLIWGVAGCNKDSGSGGTSSAHSNTPTIGFVDPSRIIAGVGWNVDAQKNLQTTESEIRRQIQGHLNGVQVTYEQKRDAIFAIAKVPSEQRAVLNSRRSTRSDLENAGLNSKQIEELLAASNVLQNELNTGNNAVQQVMTRQNNAIAAAYQDVLNPIVREVAKSTGRTAVFAAVQAAYFDASLDMTDDVIKEIQKRPAVKITFPDIPKLEFSATTQPTSAPSLQPSAPGMPTTHP